MLDIQKADRSHPVQLPVEGSLLDVLQTFTPWTLYKIQAANFVEEEVWNTYDHLSKQQKSRVDTGGDMTRSWLYWLTN